MGYFSPRFLPTARGFDSFVGYLNGENYYWSKRLPDYPEHVDFMSADATCYAAYGGSDMHNYSTILYTNHALSIIEDHAQDESTDPFFLYVAYQAVHDPFVDHGKHSNGMPDSYLDATVLESIHSSIKGVKRREYVKALSLMDTGIGQIYDKLSDTGLLDNTYLIFMSDNGG